MTATTPRYDAVRRHGRDILMPYEWLTRTAGFTLSADHIDRLIDRINGGTLSTVPDAIGNHADGMLTDAETEQLLDGTDPFADQAPDDEPMPCTTHVDGVLRAARTVIDEYEAEPFYLDDSDAAVERDLSYFDRLTEALNGLTDPDQPQPPTPAYDTDQRDLYRALVQTCRPHGPITSATYALLHAIVTTLTKTADADHDTSETAP